MGDTLGTALHTVKNGRLFKELAKLHLETRATEEITVKVTATHPVPAFLLARALVLQSWRRRNAGMGAGWIDGYFNIAERIFRFGDVYDELDLKP